MWDKESVKSEEKREKKLSVGRPEVNLSEIEWVVFDEADVLFGMPASVSICLSSYICVEQIPTSLTDQTDIEFVKEEIFGPVTVIIKFKNPRMKF